MTGRPLGTPTLLGLPYDASSSFLKGTAAAPPLIRQALHSPAGNPCTETGVDLGAAGAPDDAGDAPPGGPAAQRWGILGRSFVCKHDFHPPHVGCTPRR